MLFTVYEALCQKPKDLTLTQQRQPTMSHSIGMVLPCAVWHSRNGLSPYSTSKRKITYEDCNSSVHVLVAPADLVELPKGRPFLYETFLYETFLILSAQGKNDWSGWKIHRIRESELAWKLCCKPGTLPNASPWPEELLLSGHAVIETVNHWHEIHSYQSPIIAGIIKTSAGLQLFCQKRHFVNFL